MKDFVMKCPKSLQGKFDLPRQSIANIFSIDGDCSVSRICLFCFCFSYKDFSIFASLNMSSNTIEHVFPYFHFNVVTDDVAMFVLLFCFSIILQGDQICTKQISGFPRLWQIYKTSNCNLILLQSFRRKVFLQFSSNAFHFSQVTELREYSASES